VFGHSQMPIIIIIIMLNFNTFHFLLIYIFTTFTFYLLSYLNGILFDFTFTVFYFMKIQQVILLFCLCLKVFLSVKESFKGELHQLQA